MSLILAALHRYPIKSCSGEVVESVEVGPRGGRGDREFLVTDAAEGAFLTQREHPRLALVTPRVSPYTSPIVSERESVREGGADGAVQVLSLDAPEMPHLAVNVRGDGARRTVIVWSDRCRAVDQGDEVADWFSNYLGRPARLARMADDFTRRVDSRYATSPTDQVGFADGYPFLIISEESLADLNRRLDPPLPMNRFRPNLVIRGEEPFVEDRLEAFRIGGVIFRVVKPCARCVITTTDQSTARVGAEPLATLARFRRVGHKILFGQNLTHEGTGTIRVGDAVERI